MSNPAPVSAVMAAYNAEAFVCEAIESVRAQTVPVAELVIVDDGSTDGSGAELDRFVRRFPDVFTVIHQANSGGPAAPSNRRRARS